MGQTILCSDLGQTSTFGPREGFRVGIKLCMNLGYDDERIREMISANTAHSASRFFAKTKCNFT
ncbi:hypothetical protein CWO89_31835 [Bradyrhizobium sp. Leo170]|nr:hypothetical protein CWO89_31835 [Bradyrhizobium sp. Leo170]